MLLAAFALIESRHRAPLVPLRILRSRTLVGANLVMLLVGAVAVAMPFVLTLYAQQVLGYSAVEFGLGSAVLAVWRSGRRDRRPGRRSSGSASGPVAATGMALMGAGSLLLTQVSVGGSYFGDIFFGLLVCGPGIGLAFVTATVAALAGVAEHESGLASGLSNTAFQIGAALGVAIVTTVAVSRSEHYLAANEGANRLVALTEGFQSAFLAVRSCWPGSAWRWRSCSSAGRAAAPQKQAELEPWRPGARGRLSRQRDNANERRTEMGKIVISENVSLDGVIQDPAGDEGFRRGGWVGRIAAAQELAKVHARRGAGRRGPAAGSAELRVVRRAVAIPEWRVGGQVEQPAQVRRVLDPRGSRLEQLDGTEGRRGRRGLEAEAGAGRGNRRPRPASSSCAR